MASDDTLAALAAVYHDPVRFVKEFLGATCEPWQVEFLQNVSKYDRIAVRSGHGSGKSTALAWIGLWALLTRFPVAVVITAPSAGQIDNAFWPALRTWHRRLPPAFRDLIDITSDRAQIIGAEGESFLVARTSSKEKPEALQGVHQENTFLIIDEASGVDEIVFETASGSLSTKGAKVIMASNPTRTSGYFFDAFHRMAHLWTLQKVSALDSRYSCSGPMIAEWAAKKSTNPNGYRVRVLGEFPTGDDDVLIARALLEDAIARAKPEIEVRLPDGNTIIKQNEDYVAATSAPHIWGVDIARYGDDASALVKRSGNSILDIKVWAKQDLMATTGKIVTEFNNAPDHEKPAEIYIDVIGLGAGVFDRLKELGLPARECNVAARPFEPEQYLRLRDEIWDRTREWFANGMARMPDNPELVAELCTPRFKIESTGKMKVESKSEMKARGYASPNMADALCMTMMNRQANMHLFNKSFTYAIPDAYFT